MTEPTIRPPAPHGASPDGPVGGADGAFEFSPQGAAWQQAALDVVRNHPIPCILGAAALGFWLGRTKGRVITAAVAGLATNAVMRQLTHIFDSSEF